MFPSRTRAALDQWMEGLSIKLSLRLWLSKGPKVSFLSDGLRYFVTADETLVRPLFQPSQDFRDRCLVVGVVRAGLTSQRGGQTSRMHALPDLSGRHGSTAVPSEVSQNELVRRSVGIDGSGKLYS